jgi:hypothetical protein
LSKKKINRQLFFFFISTKDGFPLILHFYPKVMNWVRIGILDAAIEIAFLAIFSATPLISKSILPGLTTATQYSGDPFPEPIRVSVGLSVTGLSGNIRTHIFPPRRAFRVIALRPASICLDVIQAGSSA